MTGDGHNSASFNSYALQYGDLFTVNASVYKKYFEPSILQCEGRWSKLRGNKNDAGNSFEFELGLIENKDHPNAICAFDGSKHIIMMYHTFPLMLLELFARLMTIEHFLSGIGNPKLSQNSELTFKSAPGFAIVSGEVKISHVDDLMTIFAPTCGVRREIAFRLYHYAMESIWEHEMTHAIHGHVHFFKTLSLGNLNECYIHRSDMMKKNAVFQYAEMVADRGAVFSVVMSDLYQKFHRPFAVTSNDDKTILDCTLRILAGSLVPFLLMLSDVIANAGDVESVQYWSDHPSSLSRALQPALTAMSQSGALPLELKSIIETSSLRCMQELLTLSDTSGLFTPFRWLAREDMTDKLITPNFNLDPEAMDKLKREFAFFSYRHPALNGKQ